MARPNGTKGSGKSDSKLSRPTGNRRQPQRKLEAEASKVGKRGTVVIPAVLRRRFGIEEGSMVIAEAREDGILLRPAAVLPIEIYTPERKAQFLLSNALDRHDYEQARRTVRAMGLDPDRVPHYKPPKR